MSRVPNLKARGLIPDDLIALCQSHLKKVGYKCGVRLYIPASESTRMRRSAILTRDERSAIVALVTEAADGDRGKVVNDCADRYEKTPSYIYRLVREAKQSKEKHNGRRSTAV